MKFLSVSIIFTLCVLSSLVQAKDQPVVVGQSTPDFAMKTVTGKTVKLRELASDKQNNSSGITVLTFWCSFCGSCRHVEHPLSRLATKYRGQVAIMAIDSSVGESGSDVAAFLKEQKLTMPVMMDAKGRVADLFGAKMTTTTVIIDGQGKLRYFGQFKQGQTNLVEDAIKAILAGNKPSHNKTAERG
jgi:thiol-disulfide isomerase/thioredoxin